MKKQAIHNLQPAQQGEVVLYQPDETICLEVRVDAHTVWLNRQQMVQLFDRDVKTIGKHINTALRSEPNTEPTVAKFATVQQEGARMVKLPYEATVRNFRTVQFEGGRMHETSASELLNLIR